MGHMFLVIVNAHSKWSDVHIVSSITSAKTIEIVRSVFAIHELPRVIVSDNGSSFTSEKFKNFVRKNGIKHVTSAPYHPSTNSQAERAVQTLKRGLKVHLGTVFKNTSRGFFLTIELCHRRQLVFLHVRC